MIVAVTGHTEPVYVQKALDSGMNMVLEKPIQVDLLKKVFQKLSFTYSVKSRQTTHLPLFSSPTILQENELSVNHLENINHL
tara:strand:- start:167 stop:412 length:246 start_codon:yes stop_codon:yes gene_type:complete